MNLSAKSVAPMIVSLAAVLGFATPGTGQAQGCPDPQYICTHYHPGSVATNYCGYAECFQMNYGTEMRVTAVDEQGLFPRTWHAWHSGSLVTPMNCDTKRSGNKTKLTIPDPGVRYICMVTQQMSDGRLYYHHFASNPNSGCLGWVECSPLQ